MPSKVLEVKNLVKDYNPAKAVSADRQAEQAGTRAVNGVSFEIQEGEIVGLLGPNGAGKTTTLAMLLDLITPTSGQIKIFGKDLRQNREEILKKMNFSSAYVSLPLNLTGWENLLTFARLYEVENPRAKILELASFFEIEEALPKVLRAFSSGQVTRLNLCKALLNDPKLLLLDEPTASLDPDIADKTRKLLLKIRKDRNLSILYTSHNMAEIEELCDRVIFLKEGKILATDTSQNLISKFGRKNLEEVFLKIAREEI